MKLNRPSARSACRPTPRLPRLSAGLKPTPEDHAIEKMELQCSNAPKFTLLASLSRSHGGEKAPLRTSLLKKSDKFVRRRMKPSVTYGKAKKLKHYFKGTPSRWWPKTPGGNHLKDANGRAAKGLELDPIPSSTSHERPSSRRSLDFFVDWAEMYPPVPTPRTGRCTSTLKMRTGLGARSSSPLLRRPADVLQIHFAASNNVAGQASGDWDAKDANMASYRFHVQQLSGFFDGCEFHHVPRANNEAADALSKIGSTRQAIPPGIALQHLRKPSITPSPDSDSIFMPADLWGSANRGFSIKVGVCQTRGSTTTRRLFSRTRGFSAKLGLSAKPAGSTAELATMQLN
ncbi:hypothetical protein QYE76_048795 [Lolium multiflorum]|uniref:RNase H type-1 domain-containing protein n=1 Tax=Lolium multiflorum TaxID=4521 RepID=A0AAD8SNS9_LOLMU|nr:hypothetical protein QYE76_048795 [Lolium multiflorum]